MTRVGRVLLLLTGLLVLVADLHPVQAKPRTAPPKTAAPRRDPARRCGLKRYCKEMASCQEAYFYLRQCGVTQLDRDRDGVPCEWGPCGR